MREDIHNIILTGIPRSGTSLTCSLLNQLPNTIALVEPLPSETMRHFKNSHADYEMIDFFFKKTRRSLLLTGTAASNQVRGKVPDNTVNAGFLAWLPSKLRKEVLSERFFPFLRRKSHASVALIKLEKELTDDFCLCIKHPISFTTILETLTRYYPCYALIRNPLAVLASWNTVPFNIRHGRAQFAEERDAELEQQLMQTEQRLERQLILLSWFFAKFIKLLPAEHVIRYEDIIASGGRALSVITPQAINLNLFLKNKNQNHLYDRRLMQELAEKLLKTDSACWHYYRQEEVEALVEEQ